MDDLFFPRGGVVCGVDEVGRAPLAGPVLAGAVILPDGHGIEGLTDSKLLPAPKREAIHAAIMAAGIPVGIGMASVEEIDRLNILQASLLAMARAVAALPVRPAGALIDGNQPPRLDIPVRCIVRGDLSEPAISAASIVAKVTRDRLMRELAAECPGYGWERNVGYPTEEHRAAIIRLGPTVHHRRRFGTVRILLESRTSA